jgi:hypothetical protein
MLVTETGQASERLGVREIDDDEGRLLVRIIRRVTNRGDLAAGAGGAGDGLVSGGGFG